MRNPVPLPLEQLLALLKKSDNWVLLDSSLPGGEGQRSFLFLNPLRILRADKSEEIPGLLNSLETEVNQGLWAAGALAYEAAFGIERAFDGAGASSSGTPLAWFGLYNSPLVFEHACGRWSGGEPPLGKPDAQTGGWEIANLRLDCRLERFVADVERIRSLIAEGLTYQVNYTRRLNFTFQGDELGLYLALRKAQPVPYAAMIRSGGWRVLSFSPELFFRTEGSGWITTRPMKGTCARGVDIRGDYKRAGRLRRDPKNRAENLMIVDLLRNDLGRLCRTGSVQVPRLFDIERYRSLMQMTSTVQGQLAGGIGVSGILDKIFPSGSVTGAPKISTIKIISSLEDSPRGIYTGAIGYAAPGGESCFSVAIRTLELSGEQGTMGAGCGIVADSDGRAEYEECLLKARFLTGLDNEPERFSLLETMLAQSGRVELLKSHLDRMGDSARYFGFPFSRRVAQRAVLTEIAGRVQRLKIRLLLDSRGNYTTESSEVSPVDSPQKVALWPERINNSGMWFRHKTTNRGLYDKARILAAEKGLYDFLFINTQGRVAEGAITTVYVEREGVLYTPPVRDGALPGVYRRFLKARGAPVVRERSMTAEDLHAAERIWLSNALTGLVEAVLVECQPSGQ